MRNQLFILFFALMGIATTMPSFGDDEVTNVALLKPVVISVTGNTPADGAGECPLAVTDGKLDFAPQAHRMPDGCVGWCDANYNTLMTVKVTIDLRSTYHISKIRYNVGNVPRADTWNADTMGTVFGTIGTNAGTPGHGAWTEQTGDATTDKVDIIFTKTRTSWATDWLFICEVEIYGTPVKR